MMMTILIITIDNDDRLVITYKICHQLTEKLLLSNTHFDQLDLKEKFTLK